MGSISQFSLLQWGSVWHNQSCLLISGVWVCLRIPACYHSIFSSDWFSRLFVPRGSPSVPTSLVLAAGQICLFGIWSSWLLNLHSFGVHLLLACWKRCSARVLKTAPARVSYWRHHIWISCCHIYRLGALTDQQIQTIRGRTFSCPTLQWHNLETSLEIMMHPFLSSLDFTFCFNWLECSYIGGIVLPLLHHFSVI